MAKVKLLLLLFLLIIPFISSAPPLQTNTIVGSGLQIETPSFTVHPLGNNLHFSAHVHNATTGVLVTNATVSCDFHIYNSTGQHIIENQIMTYSISGKDFEYTVLANNFTLGDYAYLINCQNAGSYGGFKSVGFEITRSGKLLETSHSILYLGLLFVFFFLFAMLVYIAQRLPEEHEQQEDGEFISRSWLKYLHSTLLFSGYMLIVGLLFASGSLALGYFNDETVGKMLFAGFNVLMALAYPIVVIWFVWIIASIFRDKKTKHMIEKGIFPNHGI